MAKAAPINVAANELNPPSFGLASAPKFDVGAVMPAVEMTAKKPAQKTIADDSAAVPAPIPRLGILS